MKNVPEYPDSEDSLVMELASECGLEDFVEAKALYELASDLIDTRGGILEGPHLKFVQAYLRPHSWKCAIIHNYNADSIEEATS